LGLQTTKYFAKHLGIEVNNMGCNTTKEAIQPVEDSSTRASQDTQNNQTKIANNAVKAVPEIGEYVCLLLNQTGFTILVTSVAMQYGETLKLCRITLYEVSTCRGINCHRFCFKLRISGGEMKLHFNEWR
jgi:hypothetical protein